MKRDRPILFSAPMVRALLDGRKTQTRRVTDQPPPECSINYMLGNESWLPAEQRSPIRRTFEAWGGDLYRNKPEKALCGAFDIVPRYQIGDRLWVRESGVQLGNAVDEGRERDGYEVCGFRYAADEATIYLPGMFEGHDYERRRNSIHMPRWASRLTLTVTDVRVQRLQEISAADAIAEGVIRQDPTAEDEGWNRQRAEDEGIDASPMSPVWLAPGTRQGFGPRADDPQWGPTPEFAFRLLWDSLNAARGFGWDVNPWVVAVTFDPKHGNIDQIAGGA